MCIKLLRTLPIALCAAFLTFSTLAALAQTTDAKTPSATAADPALEFTEAARQISGPAGNPECVWLGRRVVSLLSRDDLDTAFRHLDLYDRFGCPGPHIQQAFRCVVRQGSISPKTSTDINDRVHKCWLNPASLPQPAAAAPTPTGAR
jgi:hypothetical protein